MQPGKAIGRVDVALTGRDFAPPAEGIEGPDSEAVANMMFLRLRSGWNEPIHPTSVRQKLVCLVGCAGVAASGAALGGISRGDVWHMPDRQARPAGKGKGHHTVATGKEDFEARIVRY